MNSRRTVNSWNWLWIIGMERLRCSMNLGNLTIFSVLSICHFHKPCIHVKFLNTKHHYWKWTVHLHTWSWKLTEMTISNLRPPLLEIFGTKVSNFSNKENANMTKANISKAKGDLWKKEKFFSKVCNPIQVEVIQRGGLFREMIFFVIWVHCTFVVNEISSVTNMFVQWTNIFT